MQGAAKLKGWLQVAATVALVSLLAACGGGGGGGNNSSSSSSSSSSTSGLPASPTAQPIASTASNTTAITVGQGVASVINIPTVTVTVCVPGTSNCQSIPNVQVDTGSFGLRIVYSVLNSSLQSGLSTATASNGNTLAECTNFADGYSWGTVRTATVQISGETAASIPIQVLGDMPTGSVPTGCASGAEEDTANALGANGILGIGVAPVDCGATCASSSQSSNYYACSGSSCANTAVAISSQVANPVSRFTADNNGVIVQMPPISSTGNGSATGTLVFGIGTQSNNTLAAAQTFTTDSFGDLNNSTFNGTKVQAFFDSGSNAYFFTDSTLTLCGSTYSGFYCPSSGQTRSVSVVGLNGAAVTANLGILSAATLFANGSNYAFNDLAGQIGAAGSFDIGLPFFYGRYMYFAIDQTPIGGTQSPYVGY